MDIIAVANLKGGVGKTTIAVNLACRLNATVIDADAQASAMNYAAQDELTAPVVAKPLDDARGAGAWVAAVMALDAVVIIIDCPPQVGAATEAAVGIADLVLIPCTPSVADMLATASAIELVHRGRAARRDKGPKALMVPSRVDRRTAAGRELPDALKSFNEPVAQPIRQLSAFADAFGAGVGVHDFARGGSADIDMRALARKVRGMLK